MYWRLRLAKFQAKIALKEFEKPLVLKEYAMSETKREYMDRIKRERVSNEARSVSELHGMVIQLETMKVQLNKIPMNPGNMIAIIEGKSELERAIRKIKIISANS